MFKKNNYLEYIKSSYRSTGKKHANPVQNGGKLLNTLQKRISKKPMKIFTVITEMQVKTTKRFHYTPTMIMERKTNQQQWKISVSEDVEQSICSYITAGRLISTIILLNWQYLLKLSMLRGRS